MPDRQGSGCCHRICPLAVSAADFSHADELIARARKATGSWLDEGGPDLPKPERFLSMHDHNSPRSLLRGAHTIWSLRRRPQEVTSLPAPQPEHHLSTGRDHCGGQTCKSIGGQTTRLHTQSWNVVVGSAV